MVHTMADTNFQSFSEALCSDYDGGGIEVVRRELWEKYKKAVKAGKRPLCLLC